MARIHGKGSKYLIRQDWVSRIFSVIYLLILGLVLWAIFVENLANLSTISSTVTAIILVAPLTWFIYRLYKKQRETSGRFSKGRKSEEIILNELSKLPDDYVILQGLEIKGGDIDFTVVGPTGIFAIDAKSHSGEITFNGKELLRDNASFEKNILSQSKNEALRLQKIILERTDRKYFVTPVIVFSSPFARLKFGSKPVENVLIIGKEFLNKAIMEKSPDLSPKEVLRVEKEVLYKLQKQ